MSYNRAFYATECDNNPEETFKYQGRYESQILHAADADLQGLVPDFVARLQTMGRFILCGTGRKPVCEKFLETFRESDAFQEFESRLECTDVGNYTIVHIPIEQSVKFITAVVMSKGIITRQRYKSFHLFYSLKKAVSM